MGLPVLSGAVARGALTRMFERRMRERRWGRPSAWAALALLGLLAAEARAEAGLSVETGSPDALCPDLGSTRAAVRRRLGELIVPGGSSGFRARYTIGHAPSGSPRDFVRLELFGPEGQLRLSRDLPLEGESCSAMAEVIALVLDRYFRAVLAGEPGAPAEEPAAPAPEVGTGPGSPPPLTGAPFPSPALAGPESDRAGAPDGARAESVGSGRALVGLELAFAAPAQAALGLRALFEPWPQLFVGSGVHVGLLPEREALIDGGEVTSRQLTWRGYVGWGPELGRVRLHVGPGIRLGIERGTGRELARGGSGYRALWAVGLDGGAWWVSDGGWSVAASLALDVALPELGGRFYIDGQEVLEPAALRGWLGLAVGRAF